MLRVAPHQLTTGRENIRHEARHCHHHRRRTGGTYRLNPQVLSYDTLSFCLYQLLTGSGDQVAGSGTNGVEGRYPAKRG